MDLVELATTPLLAYLVVTAVVAFDAMFPAVPSDAFLVPAGALAAVGSLELGWVLVAAVFGAVVGDHAVYRVARHSLPGVLQRSRVGRRVRRNVDRAYGRIETVGTVTLAMARFVPFGRTAAAATAGLVRIAPRRYVWISLLGALAWASWMVGLGYVLGGTMNGPMWLEAAVGVAVGFVVAAGLTMLGQAIARRRSRCAPVEISSKRASSATDLSSVSSPGP
jgi:membrane-associated protein